MPEIDPQSEHLTINSLVTKIVLMVFAGSFAAAMLVSWAAIKPTQEFIARSIDERYPKAVQHAAESTSAWLSAGREELVRATSPAWDGALEDLLDESRYFEGFALCDSHTEFSDGVGSVPICPPAREDPLPESQWIATSLANGVVVPAAVVRVSREDEPAVYAVGVFDRKQLTLLLANHSPDPRGNMLLTLGTGGVLVGGGPNPSTRIETPDPGREAGGGVRESTDSPWRHTVNTIHPLGGLLEGSGWLAAFEIRFAEAYSSLLTLMRRVLLIDLVAILLLCFAAYRITSAVLNPIESLSVGARRVAQGEFEFEIPDPGTRDELGVLINAFNRMLQRVRTSQDEIKESNENLRTHNIKLQQANELLEQLSITDGLTKLHNHRFFQDQLTREIRRVERASTPLSLLLIDIDDFKSLNDRFGHAAGDDLLRGLAQIMNATVRSSDLLARYGGEEFAVLAPGTDQDGAYQLAEKLRTAIAESSFILGDTMRLTRVTVSVGVSQFMGNRKHFFEQADRALYRAKAGGKNCVMVGEDDSIG